MATSKIAHSKPAISSFYASSPITKKYKIGGGVTSFLVIISTLGGTGLNGYNSINILEFGWENTATELHTLIGTLPKDVISVTRTDKEVSISIVSTSRVTIIPIGAVSNDWIN